ncbi:MAG: hypothetical protein M3460_24340 [Actinomycetota bacterium]|nr:hypothetical protein [Actinomycetota bacterium]
MIAKLMDSQGDRAFPRQKEPTGALGQDTEALSRACYDNAARRERIRPGNGLGAFVQ